jgi:hypothetical protein
VETTLDEATDEYHVKFRVKPDENELPVGLYRVGCTVENRNWPGAVGFNEGLVLQIYKKRT